MIDFTRLPENLPEPEDDGAAAHLPGRALPAAALEASDGSMVRLDELGPGRTVIYAYPLTGSPDGATMPAGWDLIPGARGCTVEACAFRDHHAELLAAGASAVFGVSVQGRDYQREVVERLHLPFAMLSDARFELTQALQLPTFEAGGLTLLRRLTLVVTGGAIEHVFYPVFPPDRHADEVLQWLRANPGTIEA